MNVGNPISAPAAAAARTPVQPTTPQASPKQRALRRSTDPLTAPNPLPSSKLTKGPDGKPQSLDALRGGPAATEAGHPVSGLKASVALGATLGACGAGAGAWAGYEYVMPALGGAVSDATEAVRITVDVASVAVPAIVGGIVAYKGGKAVGGILDCCDPDTNKS